MDLKRFLPGHEKEESQPEYFWSLIIEPGWVQAGTWRITGETAQVINGSASYPWELDEELVNAADSALSSAIAGFPEGLDEPSKTVFGVISSWVSDGQIKDEYLEKVKRICSDLSLTPIGFVVVPESIAHLLKSEEGSPVNAILVGVYKELLEVSVFKLGNLLGNTQVTRSLSVIEDITEGISRFAHRDSVPARLILYNGKESELEETKRSLVNVAWDDITQIQFLHTPKIEIFAPSRKVDAVSLAGASEVSGVANLLGHEEKTTHDLVEDHIPPETDVENVSMTPQDMGFVVDGDIEKTVFDEEEKQEIPPEYTENEIEESSHASLAAGFGGVFTKFTTPLKRVSSRFSGSFVKGPFVIGALVLILLLGVGFAAWWYYPKAVVTIYISPKQLDEKIEISVDPSASASSAADKVLAGQTVKQTVNGEKTKQTTGTKTIGDKAKGEVTLYRVGSALNLKSGTILTSSDKLKFVLDQDSEIASGSASSPGTTKASVSGESIGSEYNLASGNSFSVGSYSSSDIEAKNEEAFSGGSSQEISAVSADDQKSLENELVNELKDQAKEEMISTLDDTDIFIDDSIATVVSSKTFSQKVGDEAKSVGLKLTLDAEAVTVPKSELFQLAQDAVKEKIPAGFVLREDQIDTTFNFEKKEGNIYKFEVLVSANLLPETKTDDIAKAIRGKYPSLAQEYLVKEVPGFARAEIVLRPKLPGKLGTLPQVSKNIQVEVAAER